MGRADRIPDTYETVERGRIEDLGSETVLLRHKKTGARIALLLNDDENKVFYIGFRTPPETSDGVAHIIEHTVLCGSRAFPVKDPFMELAKGSLNTFLNAMTFTDKTVYPVASCNEQDFKNLMHVYLDAVFYPNIYHDRRIFMQEGWHYELHDPDDEIVINGVVYNEMKGDRSLPDSILGTETRASLLPDTSYAFESGGDPDEIPSLTYESYLGFHRTYYHPSNSFLYLYGDIDVYERLTWIDEHYLSAFDRQEVDSAPKLQKPFTEPRDVEKPYAVLPDASEAESTYLTYNVCAETVLDPELYVALDVLDYALCSASGAVLKQALLDAGIGLDVYSSCNTGIRQPVFSIVARGAERDRKDDFVRTVRETLGKIVRDGFDKKALYAGLNMNEFSFREADFGRYPKGLIYGLQVLDSWLYDEEKPWIHIDAADTYRKLKRRIEEGWFEQLVGELFLDNPHRSTLVLYPERGLVQKKDAALAKRMGAWKASLSQEQLRELTEATADLLQWQETPDTEENLKTIPMLTRADLRREAESFRNEERTAGHTRVLFHDVQTNGICYISFIFDMDRVPEELYPYAGILKTSLGMVDTEHYAYADLANEINIRTGGFSGSVTTYPQNDDPSRYLRTFEINVKVLRDRISDGFDLAREILTTSRFIDPKRLKEILDEMRSHMQDDLIYGGSQAAALRAMSHLTEPAKIADTVNGLGAYHMVERLASDRGARKALWRKLRKLSHVLFRKENLLIDFTAPASDYEAFAPLAAAFADSLFTDPVQEGFYSPVLTRENEAFQSAGEVQYVCRAGNFRAHGLDYTGRLRLLKTLLSTDYLWNNIRVKGGAYGASVAFGRNGSGYFVTYRDPHLKRSVDVFEQAVDYLRNFTADDRTMTQYVIGAVSELDIPKTPHAKGSYGLAAYMTGLTYEQIQKDRDALLDADEESLRALAPYLEAILSDRVLCVIGAEGKIDEHRDLFDRVDTLFHDAGSTEQDGEDAPDET